MNSFDSLSLKYFFEENADFIKGAVVQKIQLPGRHEIILNLRNIDKSENRKLYININPKYPHICFVNEKTLNLRNIKIPKAPPMFCMQLRKYLNSSKIKDFRHAEYERILELYFDYFDEIGSLCRFCLALEFMGKHSNIILYNAKNKTITGSIHNISADKSSIREIYGGVNYILPPLKNKLDILSVSYSTFFEILQNTKSEDRINVLNENFYYFSKPLLKKVLEKNTAQEDIFNFLQNLESGRNKEFIKDFWGGGENINDAIDEYFSKIMFEEILESKKAKLKKIIQKELKKFSSALKNPPDDKKAQKYKKFADLIMMNFYNIKPGQKKLEAEGISVDLDENKDANENAQNYYTLYKKAKGEFEHSKIRYNRAKEKSEYFETIALNIEIAASFEETDEIKEELIEAGLISDESYRKNKKEEIKLEKKEFGGFEIFVGKNNKQNDFLISKIASAEDLWFHGLNFPSAHVILKILPDKKAPAAEVLEFCAALVKENSHAKNSGKTSIIMTKRKNLKKPPNTYPGYVTYKNETEIVI